MLIILTTIKVEFLVNSKEYLEMVLWPLLENFMMSSGISGKQMDIMIPTLLDSKMFLNFKLGIWKIDRHTTKSDLGTL